MTTSDDLHDFEGESTHFTHSYLWSAANWALRNGTETDAYVAHGGLLALIAGALAVEAFLNYLGPCVSPGWGRDEEWLRPKDKLKAICEALGFTLDFNRSDYAAFVRLFELRNKLAHGRPETVSGIWRQMYWKHERRKELASEWMYYAQPEQSHRLLGLVHDLLAEIGLFAGEAEESDEYEPFSDLSSTRAQPRRRD
jgi:hypothetical protein